MGLKIQDSFILSPSLKDKKPNIASPSKISKTFDTLLTDKNPDSQFQEFQEPTMMQSLHQTSSNKLTSRRQLVKQNTLRGNRSPGHVFKDNENMGPIHKI